MSRRYRTNSIVGFARPDERASLGDSHVDQAMTRIKKQQQVMVTMLTDYPVSLERTLSMLFRDDDIDKLSQVRDMVTTRTDTLHYDLNDRVQLGICYEGAKVPTINTSRLFIQPERVGPLLTMVSSIHAIHRQFEELKAVLRWLNRNATPGAIRYFFPQAMKLCPDSPIWKDLQEVPSRYTTPLNYNDWAQPIRDAAALVAQVMLMPSDVKERPRETMWLTFAETMVPIGGSSSYSTEAMTYNL